MNKTPFFQRRTQALTRRTIVPGHVLDLPDFPDSALKLGTSEDGFPILVEKGRKRGLASFETTFGVEVAGSTLMASTPA